MADAPVFRFFTDDAEFNITYAEYLKNEELRRRVWDKSLRRWFLGRSVFLFSEEKLSSDKVILSAMSEFDRVNRVCPIYFWAPHDQGDVDFLNDTSSTFKAMRAPNRRGKTTVTIMDVLLSVIPCDPKWWMFTKYGVKFREWDGPKKVGVGNYNISHHQQTNFPALRHWIPQAMLGRYGMYGGKRRKEEPAWSKGSPSLPLGGAAIGTEFFFFTYDQSQQVYESSAKYMWHWDEQPKEHLFDAADERTRTQRGRHVLSFTPHKVEGRPDTGAGSFIHDMCRGVITKGHIVGEYSGGLDTVPDWIYPESEKAKARKKLEEAEAMGDVKALAEMRSRFYGEWHQTAGLVYDEVVPEVHFIHPFPITKAYTLYRSIDHGSKNPTACLWAAVDAKGFIYLYREYYARGKSVPANCRAIAALCGSRLEKADRFRDVVTGDEIQRYEEVFGDEVYVKTVLDSRSFSLPEGSGRPIQWLYRANGILVQKASGKRDADRIPMVKALLQIDPERRNPITGKMGSPLLFIFNTLTAFRREWVNYVWVEAKHGQDETRNPQEKARDKDNHLMTALAYLCQIPPRYMGDLPWMGKSIREDATPMETNATTGY